MNITPDTLLDIDYEDYKTARELSEHAIALGLPLIVLIEDNVSAAFRNSYLANQDVERLIAAGFEPEELTVFDARQILSETSQASD